MAINDAVNRAQSFRNIIKGDKVIWMIFFILCLISIVEVYSASSVLGYKSGNYNRAITFHVITLVAGAGFMAIVSYIPCRLFKAFIPIALLISVPTLFYATFFGSKINDAGRAIDLGLFTFQPSEFAKGTMVLITAHILSLSQTPEGASPKAMKAILIAGLFLVLPIIPENLSTGALLIAVIYMMMIIGRVPWKQLGKLTSFFAFLIGGFLFLVFAMGDTKADAPKEIQNGQHMTEVAQAAVEKEKPSSMDKIFHRFGSWKARIINHFDSEEVPPDSFNLDKDGQKGFACIAIASSNVIGRGPGNSVARDFLSLAFSDFIYAIIIEESGLIGAAFVAMLYVFLLFRTGIIAKRCENSFPAFLAMGLAMLIAIQAFFNMAVAVGIVPVTGQPLPLISKGGTSSILNCIYLGVIISVSRTAKQRVKNVNNNIQNNNNQLKQTTNNNV